MFVVIAKDSSKKLVLSMVDGFDDILVISREIEETATLPWGAKFGKYIFTRERHKVISRIQFELCSKTSEYPGCVILEFEVVFRRRGQFVTGAVSN